MNSLLLPGSVIVGVDGSASSDIALAWAVACAQDHRRPLAIVHAAGAAVVAPFGVPLEQVRRGLRLTGQGVVDRALASVRATDTSLRVSVHLELREPRELLMEVATHASVLVLGTRGRGALASLLMGSVSVALVAHAPCPVVIARSGSQDGPLADQPVIVGADGTSDSAAALTFGFELATDQRRPLEVVHAVGDAWVSPASGLMSAEMVEEVMTDWRILLAESLAGYGEKFPDVELRSRLVRGSASRALVLASETASTVVVGARGRSAARRWLLGSVSRAVVEHAACTTVVARGVDA